ncbi:MAG: formylmethanofuran dehydrogenase subunit C [Thiotrichaceae bacterium]|nr:formylmethanofuran dehydrogenase subunit C [Thiotrichaceae bacterium]
MSALRLRLHSLPPQRLDLRQLLPQHLIGLSLSAIEHLPLPMGHETIALAEFFQVYAGESNVIELQDACDKLDNIGQGLSHGELRVYGTTGAYLGKHMTGGQLLVEGDVGDYAAQQLQGGEILIRGNAGAFLAAQAGTRCAGKVIVTGNAGARAAMDMRRGFVLVEGDIGEYSAAFLQAGTLCCFGKAASGVAYGMQRGTIVLSQAPENISPTFKAGGNYAGSFLNLLQQTCSYAHSPARQFTQAQRFIGDYAMLGRGELLILCTERIIPA